MSSPSPPPAPKGRRPLSVADYVAGVRAGDRAVLSRAITLIESARPEHRAQAQAVLQELLPYTGSAQRIGITGVPGVGKSTFIDAFGTLLTGLGHKVAVLAVDPSSSRTGGSILGDKTRMARLATDRNAYIRPSPSGGTLGGVARMTRETMLLCEAAGFDVVLVETVGVGQSETMVAGMVDFFLALMLPGAGDELQGIKKGLLEIADMIAVNKADGDNRLRAQQAVSHYKHALRIIEPESPSWRPPVLMISALTGDGLEELWHEIGRHRAKLGASGELAAKRRRQQVQWMRSMLEDRLMQALRRHPAVRKLLPELERAVAEGDLTPTLAVERILRAFGVVDAPES
ncbi:methylmalonyl Co-A mutase-associated GTPase MeaB [Benzoatithermus flavus]|uniref:Methylmalonyl Co-A mutase-associated GTPase MeaB n=1 Tax=Benzoatithermus flavus TaxID=3108223 RepID=A0ABU8XXZ2_9PROT